MTSIIKRQLQLIFLAWISLCLSHCGGVIIGNPGSGPTTPKPSNSGVVKITFGDPNGESFEKVYFNIVALTFTGRESSQKIKYDQAKKIDAVRKGKSDTFEVAFEEKVNSGTYDDVTIELDPKEPIAVLLKNAKDFIIVGKNKPSITIHQKIDVLAEKEQYFHITLDLEKAIKIGESPNAAKPDGIDFDPSGNIAASASLRKITGNMNDTMNSIHLCLYRVADGSPSTIDKKLSKSTRTSTESRTSLGIREIYPEDLSRVRTDYSCPKAWSKQTISKGLFQFSGLPPAQYVSMAFLKTRLIQEDPIDLRLGDKTDLIILEPKQKAE